MKKFACIIWLLAWLQWPCGYGATPSPGLPIIGSLSKNGLLICTNLEPGTMATIEWAPTVTGPWTNTWADLEVLVANSNGVIEARVPMFYRLRVLAPAPTNMVMIPAGSFIMGDTFNEGDSDELPVHQVTLSAYWIDRYEVSQALWEEVHRWATNHGYEFDNLGSWLQGVNRSKGPDHPVHCVNWYDAVKWCNARSEMEGRIPAYYTGSNHATVYRVGRIDLTNTCVKWTAGYRLPTEAEWEMAARGGISAHRFPWPDVNTISHPKANYSADTNAYYYDVSLTQGYHPDYAFGDAPFTGPVSSLSTNSYGLFNMAGNVWEWCWDWYNPYYYSFSAIENPLGPMAGENRTVRGGSWNFDAKACRVAYRQFGYPAGRDIHVGFRTVLPVGQR